MPQHKLGVIAGGFWLDHHRLARRVQPGEQDGRFDLGRGHRQAIADGHGVAGAVNDKGQAIALAAGEFRPHLAQWLDDAAHGAPAQAGIAGEYRSDGVAGDHAHQQPRTRAGIAHIQHILGLAERANTAADDAPNAGILALCLGPQRPHGCGAAQHIFAFQQAVNLRFAHGERADHQRAVRNRFVARHARAAIERSCGSRYEWLQTLKTPDD